LYSPKLPDELVPRLWRLAQERKVPMTHLVRDAVVQYLRTEEGGKDCGVDKEARGNGEDTNSSK
jgi:predicted transcriptional regulator